jgi:hypothetical protein
MSVGGKTERLPKAEKKKFKKGLPPSGNRIR